MGDGKRTIGMGSIERRSARALLMSQVAGVPCRAIVATEPSFVTIWKSFQLVDTSGVPAEIFKNVDRAVEWIHEQMKAGPAD